MTKEDVIGFPVLAFIIAYVAGVPMPVILAIGMVYALIIVPLMSGRIILVLPVFAVIAAIAIPGLMNAQRGANEMNASASLITLIYAEADFRSNDRDNNHVNDFWTGDVSGLHCIIPAGADRPIDLIDPTFALADASPLETGGGDPRRVPLDKLGDRKPKYGYWYAAVKVDDQGTPYDTKGGRNLGWFAFCAYPQDYPSTGRSTFIVGQDASVWKKDTGGKPVRQWPRDPRSEGWEPAR